MQTGPSLQDYRVELKAKIARSKHRENWHKEAMDRLKGQATSREAELNRHAEIMAEVYDEAMARLRNQPASREAELTKQMEQWLASLKEKQKEVLDLKYALTDAKEWNLREDERNDRREEDLIAENAELWSQRMTFKGLADEFMLKWKMVCEQKDELTDSYHALHKEGIVLRERLRAIRTSTKIERILVLKR